MKKAIKILVVDKHRLFAAGMASVLRLLPQPVEVKELYNGVQALSELERNHDFDLVLADIEMPRVSGIDLLLALRSRHILVPVMIVSATEHAREVEREIERAMAAGARGYFTKSIAPETMLSCVEKVLRGGVCVPKDSQNLSSGTYARRADAHPGADNAPIVSARQLDILDLIERGKTNKQIARILGITQSTVKFHIAGLFRELNVQTRTECVHVARQLNIRGMSTNSD